MPEYIATVGLRYCGPDGEQHPALGRLPKDSHVSITAPDENTARVAAQNLLGDGWAFIYPAEEFWATVRNWTPHEVLAVRFDDNLTGVKSWRR